MLCATPLKSITLLKPLVPFFFLSRSGPFIQVLRGSLCKSGLLDLA